MDQSKLIVWLKISILIFCLILISIGFAFGYIYNNYKSGACINRPISYGVEKLNEINNDNFTCSCTSASGNFKPLSFNKDGLVSNNLLNIFP